MTVNKQWIYARKPNAQVGPGNFDLQEAPMPQPKEKMLGGHAVLSVGYDVVSNRSKVAAYRAPGAPIGAYAAECELDEIAEVLQVSVPTVKRDWRRAKAYLYDALQP